MIDVPVYCEMILGLPGETKQSWIDGIEKCLETGLNNSLFVYQAEIYPNTELNEQYYREKHSIRTKIVELTEIHCLPRGENYVPEYQEILIGTYSMDTDDWKQMTVFSLVTMLFHSMKLGYFLIAYLTDQLGMRAVDLIVYCCENLAPDQKSSLFENEILDEFRRYTYRILQGHGRGVLNLDYDDVYLDPEENVFLNVSENLTQFYDSLFTIVISMLNERGIKFDEALLREVFTYQKMRIPCRFPLPMQSREYEFNWNIPEYFHNLFSRHKRPLERKIMTMAVDPIDYLGNKRLFCRKGVIHGRKSGTLLNKVSTSSKFFRGNDEYIEHFSMVFDEEPEEKRPTFDELHKFSGYRTRPS